MARKRESTMNRASRRGSRGPDRRRPGRRRTAVWLLSSRHAAPVTGHGQRAGRRPRASGGPEYASVDHTLGTDDGRHGNRRPLWCSGAHGGALHRTDQSEYAVGDDQQAAGQPAFTEPGQTLPRVAGFVGRGYLLADERACSLVLVIVAVRLG